MLLEPKILPILKIKIPHLFSLFGRVHIDHTCLRHIRLAHLIIRLPSIFKRINKNYFQDPNISNYSKDAFKVFYLKLNKVLYPIHNKSASLANKRKLKKWIKLKYPSKNSKFPPRFSPKNSIKIQKSYKSLPKIPLNFASDDFF
jgi:hypothetical protein